MRDARVMAGATDSIKMRWRMRTNEICTGRRIREKNSTSWPWGSGGIKEPSKDDEDRQHAIVQKVDI
jgi:hypothetical protein